MPTSEHVNRRIVIGEGGRVASDTWGEFGPVPDGAPANLLRPRDDQAPPEYPSLAEQGANFAKAVTKWVGAGAKTRTTEEIDQLLGICQDCDQYDAEQERCRACGCPVRAAGAWRNKLVMKTESCPVGKW